MIYGERERWETVPSRIWQALHFTTSPSMRNLEIVLLMTVGKVATRRGGIRCEQMSQFLTDLSIMSQQPAEFCLESYLLVKNTL